MTLFCSGFVRVSQDRPWNGFQRVFVLLVAAAAWLPPVGAQEFHVRSWHVEDGLPEGRITALQQTPDGYLWIGTPQGLVRFDGAQFKMFDPSHTPAFSDARVASLLADNTGALWIGCESGDLLRYQHGRFQALNPPMRTTRRAAAGFVEGRIAAQEDSTRWMWSRGGDLVQDREGVVWWIVGSAGVARFQDNRWTLFTPTNGLPAQNVERLTCDKEGHAWIAAGLGLYCHRDGQWLSPPGANPLSGPLPVISPAREGGIWVASPRGSWIKDGGLVRRFQNGRWQGNLEPTPFTPNSLRSQVTALLEDRSGRLWLGTLWGGVFYSDAGGRWQPLRTEGALSQCVITCLFEDRQGAIWVGTVGEGLHRITRRPVTVLPLPAPAKENIVTASCAARDGSVWVGTDGAGAFQYRNGSFASFGRAQGLTSEHVCSIFEDSQTNLWFGTWGGLFQFKQGRFARVEGPPELGLAVLALFEDRDGSLWIGTPRGLVCQRGEEISVRRLRPGDAYLDIRSIAEDAAGNLWVGTIGQGLFRLQGAQVEQFGPDRGFTSRNARSLLCDRAGILWIGSDGAGLFRFKDGRFTAYTSADGLPCETLSSIISDTEGNLWMGSDNGVFACPTQRLQDYERGRSPALLVLRLSLEEGLGSRGLSGSGQPVSSRSADGRLWFPNMRGLAVFDPRAITGERQAINVLVESVVADGSELLPNEAGELRVPSSVRRFEFHYTAPDLASPQSLRFRHKLEGMDREWVEAGAQRVAYYSQLPPGEYRFLAMAGGADGRWHEGSRTLALRVVPRVWELRWIQMLAAVVLIAAVAGSVFIVGRRKLERLELQQALENERRRIARDMHDDLGARLTEIVLLGELAKRGEQTPGALQSQVSGMTQKVRQLVAAMDEIVWTVNPKNDSLPSLAAHLCDYTERFLVPAQLNCRLDVAETLPPVLLTAHIRHNLLLAVKEALNNAARHAAASAVRLRIQLNDDWLCVAVEDDGRGFDVRQPGRSGNGLQNMRSRMEAVGGRAEIQSEPGRGTTVTLLLPVPEREA